MLNFKVHLFRLEVPHACVPMDAEKVEKCSMGEPSTIATEAADPKRSKTSHRKVVKVRAV